MDMEKIPYNVYGVATDKDGNEYLIISPDIGDTYVMIFADGKAQVLRDTTSWTIKYYESK